MVACQPIHSRGNQDRVATKMKSSRVKVACREKCMITAIQGLGAHQTFCTCILPTLTHSRPSHLTCCSEGPWEKFKHQDWPPKPTKPCSWDKQCIQPEATIEAHDDWIHWLNCFHTVKYHSFHIFAFCMLKAVC